MKIALNGAIDTCPACGSRSIVDTREFHRRACSDGCRRGGVQNFLDASVPSGEWTVHLHVQCPRCGFAWLEETHAPETVKAVW
ncbi:MAG TPA: hypothetical protein VM531_11285 [Sphingomicrobium sp.]|jgi:endogenous inhibitor of DNA gyrase (YacG/DUF329 family)|nr:hypothetical protein [Sphingomicrobium sp.]